MVTVHQANCPPAQTAAPVPEDGESPNTPDATEDPVSTPTSSTTTSDDGDTITEAPAAGGGEGNAVPTGACTLPITFDASGALGDGNACTIKVAGFARNKANPEQDDLSGSVPVFEKGSSQ